MPVVNPSSSLSPPRRPLPRLHHRHPNLPSSPSTPPPFSSAATLSISHRLFSHAPLLLFSFVLLLYLVGLAVSPPFLTHPFFSLRPSSGKPPFNRGRRPCQEYPQLNRGPGPKIHTNISQDSGSCDYGEGKWVFDTSRRPHYSEDCLFQRNAWNCGRNKRPGLEKIFQWRWVPTECDLPLVDPLSFLIALRGMKIGFVGDSLNENFVVALLCILRTADPGAYRWKKKRAWRGAYFPKFNVTVGYHRAVLLAEYHEWQPTRTGGDLEQLGVTRGVRVDVDIPARDWINVTKFYDIFIFNTGHWWGPDKFPPENPLLFHKEGKPLIPCLGLQDGLKIVLQHMIPYMERAIPSKALKIWRMQSPRHFEGGEWNQNGSCLSDKLLTENQVETWFGLGRGGVNKEVREVNYIIEQALKGKHFQILNVTHLSEFREDAHPATWLGRKDAHIIWGQDCMHWCLPGLPDIWVDMLSAIILNYLDLQGTC